MTEHSIYQQIHDIDHRFPLSPYGYTPFSVTKPLKGQKHRRYAVLLFCKQDIKHTDTPDAVHSPGRLPEAVGAGASMSTEGAATPTSKPPPTDGTETSPDTSGSEPLTSGTETLASGTWHWRRGVKSTKTKTSAKSIVPGILPPSPTL